MELQKGQIIFSRKGRDVTHLYMVLSAQPDGTVLLVDGEKRTLEKPKAKNPRHINPTSTIQADEMDTDLQIKMALKAYMAQHGLCEQGG